MVAGNSRQTLKTHQINTIVPPTDSGLVFRIRKDSTPETAHREIYEKLGLGTEIIRPRKTGAVQKKTRHSDEKKLQALFFSSSFPKVRKLG